MSYAAASILSLQAPTPSIPTKTWCFRGAAPRASSTPAWRSPSTSWASCPTYVKRVAAASAGCAPALFLSLGLDGAQIRAETDRLDMPAFFDGDRRVPFCCKRLAMVHNLFAKLGIHPADEAIEYFGRVLDKYAGNADLTFLQLYQQTGRELCISVSNVSRGQAEYCHVNTTPGLPIRRAIRASMSLPFLWQVE